MSNVFFVEPIDRMGAGSGAVYWVLIDVGDLSYSLFDASSDLFDALCRLSGKALSPRLCRLGLSVIGYAVERGLKVVTDRPRRGDMRATISKTGDWKQIDFNFGAGRRLLVVECNEFYDISLLDCVEHGDRSNFMGYLHEYFASPLLFDDGPLKLAITRLYGLVAPLLELGLTKSPSAAIKGMLVDDLGANRYKYFFPEPQEPNYLRKFYAGGVFYLNRAYKSVDLHNVYRYDINRMYGHIMASKRLPVGNPVEVSWEEYAKHRGDDNYLYLIDCSFAFSVREGRLPCIRQKNSYFWRISEFLPDSGGEPMHMYITSLDFDAICNRYDITEFVCYRVLRFLASNRAVSSTIRCLLDAIEAAEEQGERLKRKVLKGLVVRAYGNFGRGELSETIVPYSDKGIVRTVRAAIDKIPSNYTPLAIFVAAYSRCVMYDLMEMAGDDLVYVAVDSIHCLRDMSDVLDIDPVRTGAIKLECVEDRARYIGVNTYCFEAAGEFGYVVSGVRIEGGNQISFDNFRDGFVISGGVQYKPEPYGYSKKAVRYQICEK